VQVQRLIPFTLPAFPGVVTTDKHRPGLVQPQLVSHVGPYPAGPIDATTMLQSRLLSAGIAHRRHDLVVLEHLIDGMPGMRRWEVRWQGCRDHEFNYRADLTGGRRAGEVWALDEPQPYLAAGQGADPFAADPAYYRPLGIDPTDGHWVYRWQPGRPWDDYMG
jgi:hypothetical protein